MTAVGIAIEVKAKRLSAGLIFIPVGGLEFLSLTATSEAELEGSAETELDSLELESELESEPELESDADPEPDSSPPTAGRYLFRGYTEPNIG